MKKLSNTHQKLLCYLVVFLMFILMGNSNNNPTVFIDRIFKPLQGSNWAFYYAAILVVIGLYYSLKQLHKLSGSSLIKIPPRRIIAILILLNVFSSMWDYSIQIYKGFYHDLNTIYLNREKTSIELEGNEETLNINGVIDFKNCGFTTQTFYVQITAPALIKELVNEDYFILEKEITIDPRSGKTIYLNEEVKLDKDDQSTRFGAYAFEYIIFNDQDEAIFKGNLMDYLGDSLD